jgi:hypothetical protein
VIRIDLAAQPVHEHIDDVCLRIETVIPDMLKDHRFGDDAAHVAHEIFEEGEFTRLQLDLLIAAADFAREQIEGEVRDGKARGIAGRVERRNESLHARKKFGEREGFGEVIIAAGLQAFDTVVDAGLRAEDESTGVRMPSRRSV